ncbi:right-handed parallel beta-helix repeat-containing protein [Herbiconiux flava]|uniref:Right-handed parallel beta-helix repeat-containing protein n=1 Tax=Herbiconiux flava TaxID=881268 RepID=A0A852SUN6_9MICO|nr:right-handed parallel beta-helix repeat-containing protein [Herbiconiux flava]NYD72290.1 hypothetical protein [Herbiconiux flava]GLK17747.1 hypothetical protein GCM10017602_22290 [Herbiconiux flava]
MATGAGYIDPESNLLMLGEADLAPQGQFSELINQITRTVAAVNKTRFLRNRVNVQDFGATGAGLSHDDGPAILAALAELRSRGSTGGALYFPPAKGAGYWSASPFVVEDPFVSVIGDRARMIQEMIIGKAGVEAGDYNPVQHMNVVVTGMVWRYTKIIANRHCLTVRNSRQVAIYDNEFTFGDYGVNIAAPLGAAFHSLAGIRVFSNKFETCTKPINGSDSNLWKDAAISDCMVTGNMILGAQVTNIWFQQVDGIQVLGNTTFMTGYLSKNDDPLPAGLLSKEHSIYIGSSNGVQIHGNNLFEAGLESIYLDNARGVNVTDNWCARPGQKDLRSGIKVLRLGTAEIVVANNRITLPTRHGVELWSVPGTTDDRSTGPTPNLTGNVNRYEADTPTYWGPSLITPAPPAIGSITHALIYVDAGYTGPLPDVGLHHNTAEGQLIRLDPLSPGISSYSRLGPWSALASKRPTSVTFTAGQVQNVATLKDAANLTGHFGGILVVTVKRTQSSSAKTSSYVLHVARTATTEQVNVISQLGLVAGAAVDDPSFTFAISNSVLRATAVGATAGTFQFSYTTADNLLTV